MLTIFVLAAEVQAADCHRYLMSPSTKLSVHTVWQDLSEGVSSDQLIEDLSEDPELGKLYHSLAGVTEGYTVRQHTLMVLRLLKVQFRLFDDHFHFAKFHNIRLYETLVITLALHDIGKPLAVIAGEAGLQHEFTLPILERTMRELHFTHEEIGFAKTLVDNRVFGRFVRGWADVAATREDLKRLAAAIHFSLCDFAPLQMLFYSVDAGSYPNVRSNIFTEAHGFLSPKKPEVLPLVEQECVE